MQNAIAIKTEFTQIGFESLFEVLDISIQYQITLSHNKYQQHDTTEKTESQLRKIAVLFTRCLVRIAALGSDWSKFWPKPAWVTK